MVWVCDFDPDTALYQLVCKLAKGFVNGCALARNALNWIRANHCANLFSISVKIDRIRLIDSTN
jgi:hypothetical protein